MSEDKWLGGTRTWEGVPIALRVRPGAGGPEQRRQFPFLSAVTQQLAVVRPDGLPEAAYNDSLMELDLATHRFLEGEGEGIVVLVETLAGRRSTYAYGAETKRIAGDFPRWMSKHPPHHLSLRQRPDPDWNLFQQYRRLFPF